MRNTALRLTAAAAFVAGTSEAFGDISGTYGSRDVGPDRSVYPNDSLGLGCYGIATAFAEAGPDTIDGISAAEIAVAKGVARAASAEVAAARRARPSTDTAAAMQDAATAARFSLRLGAVAPARQRLELCRLRYGTGAD